jgi:hypothetical protein
LIEASREGHTDVVKLLVEGGADINKGDMVGYYYYGGFSVDPKIVIK